MAYIHSGSVLTKEQTDELYRLAAKPIKIIFEDVTQVNMSDYNIQIKGRLSGIEAEKVISNIFGTTDIGALDCSDMTDEEIDKIIST